MASYEERWGDLRDKMDDLIGDAKKGCPDFADEIQDAFDACETPMDAVNDILDEAERSSE